MSKGGGVRSDESGGDGVRCDIERLRLGVGRGVNILEGVSGFKMGLNIEDTSFSKSASLVDPYV